MGIKRKKYSQSAVEYAIFIAAVLAAVLGMMTYYKNSKQGYAKKYSDSMGEQYSAQFSRYRNMQRTAFVGSPSAPAIRQRKGRLNNGSSFSDRVSIKPMISMTSGGNISVTTAQQLNVATAFTGISIPAAVSTSLQGVPTDFSTVELNRTVIDDFSNSKLKDDKAW